MKESKTISPPQEKKIFGSTQTKNEQKPKVLVILRGITSSQVNQAPKAKNPYPARVFLKRDCATCSAEKKQCFHSFPTTDIPVFFRIKTIKKIKENRIEKEENWPMAYFSLQVPAPNNSLSILRCFAQREVAESLEKETKPGDIIEIEGYLRNEKENRQILVIVVSFTKLDIQADQINPETSNQVQLVGKIITDSQGYQNNQDNFSSPLVSSFKISVPWEKSDFPTYFCRVQGQLAVSKVQKQLKKNDIIFLEGYLQTVKVKGEADEFEERDSRISSIICQAFTLLGNDSINGFTLFNTQDRVTWPVEKIDFSKEPPSKKSKKSVEE